jgi:hypothetical protein
MHDASIAGLGQGLLIDMAGQPHRPHVEILPQLLRAYNYLDRLDRFLRVGSLDGSP